MMDDLDPSETGVSDGLTACHLLFIYKLKCKVCPMRSFLVCR